MSKSQQKLISLIFSASILSLGIIYLVSAWTEPTQNPPLGNVPAPLNVGSIGQVKEGGLLLNRGGALIGLIVEKGDVGIGTTNPGSPLEISSTRDNILRLRQNEPGSPWNYIEFFNNAQREWTIGSYNNSFFVGQGTGDNRILNILTNGNVGIGTTSPRTPAPNNQPGNLDVNDIYIRSINSWASQRGGWPEGSYCIVQAQNQNCPAGFSVVDSRWDRGEQGWHTAIVGGDRSYFDTNKKNVPDDSSGNYPAVKWAFCCK